MKLEKQEEPCQHLVRMPKNSNSLSLMLVHKRILPLFRIKVISHRQQEGIEACVGWHITTQQNHVSIIQCPGTSRPTIVFDDMELIHKSLPLFRSDWTCPHILLDEIGTFLLYQCHDRWFHQGWGCQSKTS